MGRRRNGERPWRRAAGVIACVAEDEVRLLLRETWDYLELDQVSRRIWELLSEPKTTTQLVAALRGEYDVTIEQCQADIRALLAVLHEAGAVITG